MLGLCISFLLKDVRKDVEGFVDTAPKQQGWHRRRFEFLY